MNNVMTICVLCAFALSLGTGCGKGAAAAVKAQEGFADKTCACKDVECVKGVQKEQETWVAANGSAFAGATEDDQAKVDAAGKKMSECIQKLMAAK